MAARSTSFQSIVRELKDHVDWPKMRPGEVLDVRASDDSFLLEEGETHAIHVTRWFPDEPFGGQYREVHGVVDPDAIKRYRYTRRASHLIEAVVSTMRTLAIILSGKPPKGWRLFGRAKAPAVYWSRLRTRPVFQPYPESRPEEPR